LYIFLEQKDNEDEHVYIELDIKCRYISIFIIDYYIFFLFFCVFSCPQSKLNNHSSIQVYSQTSFFLFISSLFSPLVLSSLSSMSEFNACCYSSLIYTTNSTTFFYDTSKHNYIPSHSISFTF